MPFIRVINVQVQVETILAFRLDFNFNFRFGIRWQCRCKQSKQRHGRYQRREKAFAAVGRVCVQPVAVIFLQVNQPLCNFRVPYCGRIAAGQCAPPCYSQRRRQIQTVGVIVIHAEGAEVYTAHLAVLALRMPESAEVVTKPGKCALYVWFAQPSAAEQIGMESRSSSASLVSLAEGSEGINQINTFKEASGTEPLLVVIQHGHCGLGPGEGMHKSRKSGVGAECPVQCC